MNTAISREVVGKCARDNPERHCGWFWVHCSSKKFERICTRGHGHMFASAKGKQQKCVRQLKSSETVYQSYPILPSGLSPVHFPTTFLEIAVYDIWITLEAVPHFEWHTYSPACIMGRISCVSELFRSQAPWFVRGRSRSMVGHRRRDRDEGEDGKEWRLSTSSSFPSLPRLPRARRSPTRFPCWCLKKGNQNRRLVMSQCRGGHFEADFHCCVILTCVRT